MSKRLPESHPIGFISDVHGQHERLARVLEEMERRGVRRIYAAGDHLLGGPAPLETWRALMKAEVHCARGVSDTALAQISIERAEAAVAEAGGDQEAIEKLLAYKKVHADLGQLVVEQLRRLPLQIRIPMVDGREILLVHGSPLDPMAEMTHDTPDDDLLHLIDDEVADIIVCGASHVPFRADIGGYTVVNVGSVGEAPSGDIAHFTIITPRLDGTEILQDFVAL